jgi:hypothetical protein
MAAGVMFSSVASEGMVTWLLPVSEVTQLYSHSTLLSSAFQVLEEVFSSVGEKRNAPQGGVDWGIAGGGELADFIWLVVRSI